MGNFLCFKVILNFLHEYERLSDEEVMKIFTKNTFNEIKKSKQNKPNVS